MTGVQTCALPIFGDASQVSVTVGSGDVVVVGVEAAGAWTLSAWEGDCPEYSIGQETGVVGSTSAAEETYTSECGSVQAAITLRWVAPSSGTWTFSTSGSSFDTILSLRENTCDGAEISCDDDVSTSELTSEVTTSVSAGDVVTIVIGGYEGDSGAYELAIY